MAKRVTSSKRQGQMGSVRVPGARRTRVAQAPAIFESFALQVEARPGMSRWQTARHVVRESLGRGWSIEPLNESSGEYLVSRGSKADASRIAPGKAWEWTYALRDRPEIVYAEPLFEMATDEQFQERAAPAPAGRARRGVATKGGGSDDDPATDGNFEWSLEQLRVPAAWATFPAGHAPGDGILVGHPDTGFTSHEEIAGARLLSSRGYDFESDDSDATDPLDDGFLKNPGHGTGTSSVIFSARGSQDPGRVNFVSGVAPGASLIPIRTTRSVVLWSMAKLTLAVDYATQEKVDVISMSLGGPFPSTALRNAIRRAVNQGIIVLAAAGNQVRFVVFPAAFDEVIAVAACNIKEKPWRGSCRGPAVDVTAPGESVWRALPKRQGQVTSFVVERGNGTSFAVAATAGVAALWLSYHGKSQLIQKYGTAGVPVVFKELLEQTCNVPTVGWDTHNFGHGIVDAAALLHADLPAVSRAAGMRGMAPRAVSEDRIGTELLLHYFPDLPRTDVERAVASLLGVTENRLPEKLVQVGDELAFQIATGPALRVALARATQPGTRGLARGVVRGAPSSTRAVRHRLTKAGVSRRLQRVIDGGN